MNTQGSKKAVFESNGYGRGGDSAGRMSVIDILITAVLVFAGLFAVGMVVHFYVDKF